MSTTKGSPLDRQVGGVHYKRFSKDPIVVAVELNLDPIRYSIFKYIVRYPWKDGVRDLKKAAHFIEIGKELGVFDEGHVLPSSVLPFIFDNYKWWNDDQLFLFTGMIVASVDKILEVMNTVIYNIENPDIASL